MGFTFNVAGTMFENRDRLIAQLEGGETVWLEPEPSNPYDANAIAVKVPFDAGLDFHIGYVPRDLTARIHPLIKNGMARAKIEAISGGGEHPFTGKKKPYGVTIVTEEP